jgi:hypothetical protein
MYTVIYDRKLEVDQFPWRICRRSWIWYEIYIKRIQDSKTFKVRANIHTVCHQVQKVLLYYNQCILLKYTRLPSSNIL